MSADVLTALRLLVDAPGDLSDADLAALDALRGDLGTRLRAERERRDPQPRWRSRGYQHGWRAIAIPDGRRGVWIREHADERGLLVKVEVCAGREGDDWHVELVAGQPVDGRDLRALEDCLSTLRWVLENENNPAAPRDEERANWDETLKIDGGRVVCAVCGDQCWGGRSAECRGEAERRGIWSGGDDGR